MTKGEPLTFWRLRRALKEEARGAAMVVEICGGTDERCWRVIQRASGWCVQVSDPSSLEEGSYVSSEMERRLR